jgi:hypothetical protein
MGSPSLSHPSGNSGGCPLSLPSPLLLPLPLRV